MESLLRAMVERGQRIEVGEPVVLMNNLLRGYELQRRLSLSQLAAFPA
jgi:hypothetical protein